MRKRMGWLAFAGMATTMTMMMAASPAKAELSLLRFGVNGYGAVQSSGGNTFSGQLSWNPTLALGTTLYTRGNLGATYLKGAFASNFAAVNAQAFLGANDLLFNSLGFEAGAGLQTWFGNGGTHPILSGNVLWSVNKWFGLIDRIYAGSSYYMLTGNGTVEFRLGVGIWI